MVPDELKLVDAVRILQKPVSRDSPVLRLFLNCGFAPLHLRVFLAARMKAVFPSHRIEIDTGVYGDVVGNLQLLQRSRPDYGFVLLEWPDLDPRLGYRQLGGWRPEHLKEIINDAKRLADRIAERLSAMESIARLVVALPSLPLAPVSHAGSWQALSWEFRLREIVCHLGARLASNPGITLVNPQSLDFASPSSLRYDMRSDLTTGFPYSTGYASLLAGLMAIAARPPDPKKGVITDLDNVLWLGILGETGPAGVSWDLDHHSQIHGVYQQLLDSLASAGIFVAAASKNGPDVVKAALNRSDLIIRSDRIFPIEASWGSKSEAVGRILKIWNIGAESVVFVDDSPMELAEVASVHSRIECLHFPHTDPEKAHRFLTQLRDLCAKPSLHDEDTLRLDSIRVADTFERAVSSADGGVDFLERVDALISVSTRKKPLDPRALELVNKTNQFNLNGIRFTEVEWADRLDSAESFVLLVSYSDHFGPLGKISVVAGRCCSHTARVDTWVLSCRAFSRMVEHRCLKEIFERFDIDGLQLSFQPTDRNGYLQRFFAELIGAVPAGPFSLLRKGFEQHCPRLFHRVEFETQE